MIVISVPEQLPPKFTLSVVWLVGLDLEHPGAITIFVAMGHIIKPSRRGIANLESGAFIDLEDEITRQLPRYDPDTCPNGLIDLSGATNALMGDFMAEQAAEFAKSYALEDAFKYGEVVGPKGKVHAPDEPSIEQPAHSWPAQSCRKAWRVS